MSNILKSIFVTSFITYAIFSALQSSWLLAMDGFSYSYLGRLIASFTITFLFLKAFVLHNTARTSPNLPYRTSIIAVGFLMSTIGGTILSTLPNLLLLLGWLAYVFWYSRFDGRTQKIAVGNSLANFELEDTAKNVISSKSFLGNPTIFMFYRGNWCPLCMAQIKEIASQYKALEKRGVNMALISPQPHHFSKSLAKKYDVPFQFLVDVNNKVAKQLAIFHKNGLPAGMQMFGYKNDTVMPTVIITDAYGRIIFADLTDNYRVRPEPDTFLKILDNNAIG